jgi:death-on-curing protein
MIAAALAFYLAKAHAFVNGNKRTATAAAITVMNLNGYTLSYPPGDLAKVITAATDGSLSLEDLKLWFELHKSRQV